MLFNIFLIFPFVIFVSCFASEAASVDFMILPTRSSRGRSARWKKPGTLRQVSAATSAPLLLLLLPSASSLSPCAASASQTERRRQEERRRRGLVSQLSHMIKQHQNYPQVRRATKRGASAFLAAQRRLLKQQSHVCFCLLSFASMLM